MANKELKPLRYVDIAINLTDPVYRGSYHGKQSHPDDLQGVLSRAQAAGVQKLIVTGSDFEQSRQAVELATAHPGLCHATTGIHPCSSSTFSNHLSETTTNLLDSLRDLASTSAPHVVAFGEIGLDYDRLTLCPKKAQLTSFAAQLDIATTLKLPLFLHSRAAHDDFADLLRERMEKLPKRGVVHSFTGTVEEMQDIVAMGFHVGVNGCSLKTEENLEVVRKMPLERLQVETDGPWCELRPSHAGYKVLQENFPEVLAEGAPGRHKSVKKEKWTEGTMVKGRNEPCCIGLVAHVVAGVQGVAVEEVAEAAWRNSVNMFELEQ